MITAILFMLKKAGNPMPLGAVSCYPPYDLYTDAGEKPGAGQEPERVKNARLYNDWYVEPERRKQREEIKSQQEELLSAKAALAEKDSENQRLKALLAAKE